MEMNRPGIVRGCRRSRRRGRYAGVTQHTAHFPESQLYLQQLLADQGGVRRKQAQVLLRWLASDRVIDHAVAHLECCCRGFGRRDGSGRRFCRRFCRRCGGGGGGGCCGCCGGSRGRRCRYARTTQHRAQLPDLFSETTTVVLLGALLLLGICVGDTNPCTCTDAIQCSRFAVRFADDVPGQLARGTLGLALGTRILVTKLVKRVRIFTTARVFVVWHAVARLLCCDRRGGHRRDGYRGGDGGGGGCGGRGGGCSRGRARVALDRAEDLIHWIRLAVIR